MTFDSHVFALVDVAARLVNRLTDGSDRGRPISRPIGLELVSATSAALAGDGRREPMVTDADAAALAESAAAMRLVFEAAHRGDVGTAARQVNELLAKSGARPQLDLGHDGWQVHFHGSDDGLTSGWIAGCATGLALAIGSSLAGRLGLCDAERCDRVFVDISKNNGRRFCSTACQNRTKTAAYRARS
ncbi:CGNR zinc finger domain-containing protein [Actinoplanes sp. CA-054009]